MGYSQSVRKKKTVSQGSETCPLTVYNLLLCPMLLVTIIHLVIFVAVCCEI